MEEKKTEVKKEVKKAPAKKKATTPAKKPAAKKPVEKKEPVEQPVEQKEPVEQKDHPGARGKEKITVIPSPVEEEQSEALADEASGVTSGVTSGVEDDAPEEREAKWYERLALDLVEPTIDTGIGPETSTETDVGPATIVSDRLLVEEHSSGPSEAVAGQDMALDEDDEELMKDADYMALWEEDVYDPSLYKYDPDRPSSTIVIIVPPGWQDMQKRWFTKVIRMALWKRKEWHYKRRVVTHSFGDMLSEFEYQAKKYNTEVMVLSGCVHNQPGLMERLVGYLRGPDDLLVIADSPRHKAIVNSAIRRAKVRGAEIMFMELEEKYKKYK